MQSISSIIVSSTFLLVLFLPISCFSWPAKVIKVSDGDTITVMYSGSKEKIRLYGIDCPEMAQEYGQQAKAITNAMISGRRVEVQRVTVDRYGRTVGLVTIDGQSLNRLIVQNGYAWVYDQYCTKPICNDWRKQEKEARRLRKGLWAGSSLTPPWEWRKYVRGTKTEKEVEPPLILLGGSNGSGGHFRCDGRIHCSQMRSCEEATFFIQNCPGTKMDGDRDGVPCERQWCH